MKFHLVSSCVKVLVFLVLGLLVLIPLAGAQGLVSSDLLRYRSVGAVALSPDGHRLAYSIVMRDQPGRPYGQLWIMDLATQKSVRLGGEKDRSGGPVWSSDGKWLAFRGRQGDKGGLFIARPDGSEITYLASPGGARRFCTRRIPSRIRMSFLIMTSSP